MPSHVNETLKYWACTAFERECVETKAKEASFFFMEKFWFSFFIVGIRLNRRASMPRNRSQATLALKVSDRKKEKATTWRKRRDDSRYLTTRMKLVGVPIDCARKKDTGTNVPTKWGLPCSWSVVQMFLPVCWLNFAPGPPASHAKWLFVHKGKEKGNK